MNTREYKTPGNVREARNAEYAAIKAAGGEAYARLLEEQRLQKQAWRAKNGRASYDNKGRKTFKAHICKKARLRARKAGLEGTITVADLKWPTHCPVLGIRLDYPRYNGEGGASTKPDRPSLDRLDNTKGYVPGNVFVISYRANALKNNATPEELEAVARYARRQRSFL